jgi:hypothetical protein
LYILYSAFFIAASRCGSDPHAVYFATFKLSSDLNDLPKMDTAVAHFEAVSGAILNLNRKSVIVGLGFWEGKGDWPLPWL